MVKVGTLTKLKSAIKRWPSIPKIGRLSSSSVSVAAVSDDGADTGEKISKELHTVYVGKSRRPYFISLDVVTHPLFQELVDKSSSNEDGTVVVSCEVVMFEHLLWMLQNAAAQLSSTEELVEFYTC